MSLGLSELIANTLGFKWKGEQVATIFKGISFNKTCHGVIQISLKRFPFGPIDIQAALVQVIDSKDNKRLVEPKVPIFIDAYMHLNVLSTISHKNHHPFYCMMKVSN